MTSSRSRDTPPTGGGGTAFSSERVAHRYAQFGFLCGSSFRVRANKYLNTTRICGVGIGEVLGSEPNSSAVLSHCRKMTRSGLGLEVPRTYKTAPALRCFSRDGYPIADHWRGWVGPDVRESEQERDDPQEDGAER